MTQPSPPTQNRIAALLTRDRVGAALLLLCALITGLQASSLRLGSARMMGPGYFPWILTGLFVLFAVILLINARKDDEPIDTGPLRPVGLIIASVAVFGLLLPVTGAAVAIVALVVLAALAESGRKPVSVLVLAVVLVAVVWLVFRFGLNLQLQMYPGDRG
ncbi:tripartite tricarboxylate transporter TctB family protein [Pararhodobacter zhoushanensis]|uniref:Tripartite tricarboxylate transporter TctB family protein n=1 Tax=Pararhodobacter zhoushanensis TaxID=2479545 RepID=A0ABT3H3D5_9RHOB|nr:tripartite tricarboxylate transporter TctB family protein [Pararhodobacter zhoushanensis]MCW1934263.1 tripartite tricarboxylate transporter TctB family protein [Pararhodobacter zhoushanensis]